MWASGNMEGESKRSIFISTPTSLLFNQWSIVGWLMSLTVILKHDQQLKQLFNHAIKTCEPFQINANVLWRSQIDDLRCMRGAHATAWGYWGCELQALCQFEADAHYDSKWSDMQKADLRTGNEGHFPLGIWIIFCHASWVHTDENIRSPWPRLFSNVSR